MWFRSLILILLVTPLSTAGDASTQATGSDSLPKFTPERESAVLNFVGQNHPELKTVLGRLKTANQEQYQLAVRELAETVEKLVHVKQNDEKLYALMREAWQVKSQADLLAAQLAHAQNNKEKFQQEIKALLYRRVDLERRQVEHRRERLMEMLKATEDSLERMQENRERMVETRFHILTRDRRKSQAKTPAKPTANKGKPTEE